MGFVLQFSIFSTTIWCNNIGVSVSRPVLSDGVYWSTCSWDICFGDTRNLPRKISLCGMNGLRLHRRVEPISRATNWCNFGYWMEANYYYCRVSEEVVNE